MVRIRRTRGKNTRAGIQSSAAPPREVPVGKGVVKVDVGEATRLDSPTRTDWCYYLGWVGWLRSQIGLAQTHGRVVDWRCEAFVYLACVAVCCWDNP